MLYRKSDGTLIEINRQNYINDTIYYQEIYKFMSSISLDKMYKTNDNQSIYNDQYIGNSNESIMEYMKGK